MKRLLSMLLCAAMLLSLLPTAVWAGEPATVADFTADASAALNALGGEEKAAWDGSTLTLKGVDFNGAVILPDGATIVLEGYNTITGGIATYDPPAAALDAEEGPDSNKISCGIIAQGSLTIRGTGELEVTAPDDSVMSYGIYASDVTIEGGTVKATGGTAEYGSCGICAASDYDEVEDIIYGGNVTITGGTVTAKGGTVTATGGTATGAESASYGISAFQNVTIKGGTVNATGGMAGDERYGIYAFNGNVTISGGTVTATGGETTGAESESYGIYADNDVTISGGTVTAKGSKAGDYSYGIYAYYGSITIEDGEVYAEGGEVSSFSCGIAAYESVTITGGTVTAKGGKATGAESASCGLESESDTITISGTADVTATGGEATGAESASYGIYADNDVAIKGGTVEATGGKAEYGSRAIFASSGNITVTDGTVIATGSAAKYSYGINATSGSVKIEGGEVKATSGTAGKNSAGIYADKDVTVINGTVTAIGGEAANNSYGIEALKENVTISGGTVTATGGEAANNSYGIRAYDDVTIEDGTVTATGGEAGDKSYGIYAVDKNVTISGGHVATQTLAESAASKAALNKAPVLTAYTNYYWRTATADAYTASTTPYEYSESHTYLEIADKATYPPTITPTENGTVTVSPEAPAAGNPVTITTTPDDGFELLGKPTVTGPDGNPVELTDNGSGTFTFTQPNGNVTVTATFTEKDPDPTYPITVESGKNGSITANNNNPAAGDTVTLTVAPDKGFTLETLTVTDAGGKAITLADKGDGTYTFTMPASGVTVTAVFSRVTLRFTDVPEKAYYYDAVYWAVENGITMGTSPTKFSPNGFCTRAQTVTFLWRAAGSPAPESNAMPFTDVVKGSSYEKAVLWAVEKGITEGTSKTTFSPNATCTRAQIATFLWRAQGKPEAGTVNPFKDVVKGSYYEKAVLWAAEKGITKGTTATTFSPNDKCTRAQNVSFLYRCMGQ